jgi:hypothetical protein
LVRVSVTAWSISDVAQRLEHFGELPELEE